MSFLDIILTLALESKVIYTNALLFMLTSTFGVYMAKLGIFDVSRAIFCINIMFSELLLFLPK